MYGIPDVIVIKYTDKTGPKEFNSGSISYTGTHTFKLTANGKQDVKITVNPGNGLNGTAWEYRMYQDGLNLQDITLSPYSGSVNWRKLITGTNQSAEAPVVFDVFGQDANEQVGPFIAKVFRVTIPAGISAMRINSVGGVQITALKGCIPRPGQFIKGYSSRNRYEKNAIIFNEATIPVEPGVWYITTSITRELAYALAGFSNGAADLPAGNLTIDCYNSGTWTTATHKTSITRETESVLTGFEGSFGNTIAGPADQTIISHGRADSPAGMTTLGNAAVSQWGRETQYLNWSEASNSNPLALDGTRFIPDASAKLAKVLRLAGVKGSTSIDFLGHSWGTYMGDALAARVGKYRRFFALDPAKTGFQFNTRSVNFRGAAAYSLSIYGNGPFGNDDLAATAHDAVLLDTSALNPLTRHSEPVLLMARILAGQAPPAVLGAFSHALGASGGVWKNRLWDLNRYGEGILDGYLLGGVDFEVVLDTDGAANVSKMRYFGIATPTIEEIFQ